MDDVRAVMDAAAAERAVLFGYSEGAPVAILFAATYPERARALVLFGAFAKRLVPDDDYPWAPTREDARPLHRRTGARLGLRVRHDAHVPVGDDAMARWWGERCRAAASPGAVRALLEMNSLIDVRALLPAIHVPTLVVHRGTDSSCASRRAATSPSGSRRAVGRAAGRRPLRGDRPGPDPRRGRALRRRIRRRGLAGPAKASWRP